MAEPFWRTKSLAQMTRAEFESVCDGCARCCLVKLEDEDTGRIHYTDVACKLLDAKTCRCKDYGRRASRVPDCLKITPRTAKSYAWLPPTCGYRLIAEGKDLYWWHPLVSGDPLSVHKAGISVRGKVAGPEQDFSDDELGHHLVTWPGKFPAGRAAERKVRGTGAAKSKSGSKRKPPAPAARQKAKRNGAA